MGRAPDATATLWMTSIGTADVVNQKMGANSARMGSTWLARRDTWSPATSVLTSRCPREVVNAAWTMFPTSKRPVQ